MTTHYVYDAFGRLAAEYTTATPTEAAGSYWRTTDHLGSTRLVTDGSGSVYDRRDLFPFGEQIADTYSSRSSAGNYNDSNPASRHLFTAKERDQESGLDYFGARYFSGALGRFTSADAPFLDQYEGSPQSWNLYGYVRNNPLRLIDPTGQKCVATDDGTPYDDGTEGAACTAEQVAPDVIETVGTAGSLGAAIGYNLFFAFGNAASATFSPLFDNQPSSLRHVPLNDGLIGSLAGLGALAVEVLVGPPTNKVQITERGLKHAMARHTFYGPAKSTRAFSTLASA